MAMHGTEISCVTGWYGKLPAKGDFISRSLPRAFVRRWDAWLQSVIGSASERLGTRWRECYSGAPAWRFLLSPGIAAEGAVAGVLMPSADRVGRLFPLTIASVLDPARVDLAKTLIAAQAWFAALEAVAGASLDPALDLDAYDERIKAIVFPADDVIRLEPGSGVAPMPKDESAPTPAVHARLEPGDDGPAEEAILRLRERLVKETEPLAFWLTRSSKPFGQWALATAGLPSDEQFCAMLDGDWQGHGWS